MKTKEKFKKVVEWREFSKEGFSLAFTFIIFFWVGYIFGTQKDIASQLAITIIFVIFSAFSLVERKAHWERIK